MHSLIDMLKKSVYYIEKKKTDTNIMYGHWFKVSQNCEIVSLSWQRLFRKKKTSKKNPTKIKTNSFAVKRSTQKTKNKILEALNTKAEKLEDKIKKVSY